MTPSNSQDAFRLGCYAAAKHAGASHDEAIQFVAGLDRQALQQDAFRLGAFKTAKDHGASDEQALEFVGTVEKQAGIGLRAGQALLKGGRKLLGGLGNVVRDFTQGATGGAPAQKALRTSTDAKITGYGDAIKRLQANPNMSPQQLAAIRSSLLGKTLPGVKQTPGGSAGGTSHAELLAHLQGRHKRLVDASKGYAAPGTIAFKGTPGSAPGVVDWMGQHNVITGAGTVGAGYGAYRMGKGDEGGGAAVAKGGAPGPSGLSPYDVQMLRLLMSQQGVGGDNPWLRAGAMPYYPQ